jgi:hypothetical protein
MGLKMLKKSIILLSCILIITVFCSCNKITALRADPFVSKTPNVKSFSDMKLLYEYGASKTNALSKVSLVCDLSITAKTKKIQLSEKISTSFIKSKDYTVSLMNDYFTEYSGNTSRYSIYYDGKSTYSKKDDEKTEVKVSSDPFIKIFSNSNYLSNTSFNLKQDDVKSITDKGDYYEYDFNVNAISSFKNIAANYGFDKNRVNINSINIKAQILKKTHYLSLQMITVQFNGYVDDTKNKYTDDFTYIETMTYNNPGGYLNIAVPDFVKSAKK